MRNGVRSVLLCVAALAALAAAAPAGSGVSDTPNVAANGGSVATSGSVVSIPVLVSHTSGPFTLYTDIGTGNVGQTLLSHIETQLPATVGGDWKVTTVKWTAPATFTSGWYCVVVSANHADGPWKSSNSCRFFSVDRTPARDTTPPTVANGGDLSGTAGETVRLPFTVKDDSGRATVTISIRRGSSELASIGSPGVLSAKGELQTLGYALPADVAGALGYCVSAKDEAGNASSASCGTIAVKALPAQTGADTKAPTVQALPVSVSRKAGTITLRWRAADNSGKASFAIVVYRGTGVLGGLTVPLVPAPPAGRVIARRWTYTSPTRLTLRWCVIATDAAGNRSPASCAALTLR